MHFLVNYFCVHMLGCSTSQHKHFLKKEVQTDDLLVLHGEEVQVQLLMIRWTLQQNFKDNTFYRELSMYMYTCSWYCERCTNPFHDESQASVVCDCCLNWHHFSFAICSLMQQPCACVLVLWVCHMSVDS